MWLSYFIKSLCNFGLNNKLVFPTYLLAHYTFTAHTDIYIMRWFWIQVLDHINHIWDYWLLLMTMDCMKCMCSRVFMSDNSHSNIHTIKLVRERIIIVLLRFLWCLSVSHSIIENVERIIPLRQYKILLSTSIQKVGNKHDENRR